jgi:hypothetical protein
VRHQLLGDVQRQLPIQAALDVDAPSGLSFALVALVDIAQPSPRLQRKSKPFVRRTLARVQER